MPQDQQPLLGAGRSSHGHRPIKSSSLGRRALRLRHSLRQPLAEFLGTFLIVFIGDGVVAQWVLSEGSHSSWLNVNIAWAGAVLLGSLVAGPISGAHLNPAVSICFSLFPRNGSTFPLRKLPGYILAQMLGGFCGAAVVYLEYWTQIHTYENGSRTVPGSSILFSNGKGPTAGIFATYPLKDSTTGTSFFSEMLASALLMLGIFLITSSRNATVAASGHFSVFILLVCIGSACGWQSGYAINAARDLAPRLFTSLIYGREVFTVGQHYWWIPTVAPIVGCLLGASVYELFIGETGGVIEGLMGSLPDDDDEGSEDGELAI